MEGFMNKILSLTTVFAAAFVLAVTAVPTQPVSAASNCDGRWQYASWGRGCLFRDAYNRQKGQVDDILTDGYCVHAERYNGSTGRWVYVSGSNSCGPIVTFTANTDGDSWQKVRMVRDDGRYLTLSPAPIR